MTVGETSRHRATKGTPPPQHRYQAGRRGCHKAANQPQPPPQTPGATRRTRCPLPCGSRAALCPSSPAPRQRGTLPQRPGLSSHQLSRGKIWYGGCRRPARAGAGERGLPEGTRAPHGAGGCRRALPGRGLERGGGRDRPEGSGALAGGGCGAAVEGGNGVGGFASVRELRAGGTDGGTDGRREPAERHRPAALARRRCPSPHGAVPGARAALGMGSAAPPRPGRRRAQPRHPAPAVLAAGLPQQVSTARPGRAAGPAGPGWTGWAAEPGVPDRHCPSSPGTGAPT